MPPANSHEDIAGTLEPETDAGPPRAGKAGARDRAETPGRRCIATMETRPQAEMIRFVLSPSSEVTPDLAGRLPGRGAWVTSSREAIELAVKKGVFARAFKAQAKTGPDLPALVEQLLVRRLMDQLGLAKRAGDLILGFEQVREQVRSAPPACVIEASDGADDGRAKVLNLVRAAYGPDEGEPAGNHRLPPVITGFSADELGMALGRGRVIHACLKLGRISQAWMGELKKLSGFRRVWLEGWPSLQTGSGKASEEIEETQAHVSGGNPPDASAATEETE